MNLTIKSKLLGGYSIILLMLVLTSLFMINKFSESNARFLNLLNVSSKKINLSNQLLINLLDQGRHEKNLILASNHAEMIYFNNRMSTAIDSMDKSIVELKPLLDTDGKNLLAGIER